MTTRFVILLVAIVSYLAGTLGTYALMRPEILPAIVQTSRKPQANSESNGFTGMEFTSAAHAPMVVRHVVRGGPADRVDIKVGDHVIGFGNVVNPTISHAIKIVEASRPGDVLTVVVQRGGENLGMEVVLIDYTEYARLKELERTRMLQTKRE